jgi:S-DNA-T family DNA segregation ATPase FtsK/SpoIIIE
MLVKIVGSLRPVRLQGSLVTAPEVQAVIEFIKAHSSENYDESVMEQIDSNAAKLAKAEKRESDGEEGGANSEEFDDKFYAALKLAVDMGKISSSLLMRKLGLGFQRASRIIDQMEECGYISEPSGSKPRDTLISKEDYMEMMMRREDSFED